MAAGGPTPLPQLGVSSGPAISDAQGGMASATFGPFAVNMGQEPGIVDRVLPFAAIAGVIWLLTR